MRKFYETEEYKKEAKKWEKKLKKSGFEDLERSDGYLKEWASTPFGQRPEWDESKAEYFRLAGYFLHEYEFQSEFERRVWELHCKGDSIRITIDKLKKQKFNVYNKPNVTINKANVHGVIKKLSDLMKQKYAINGKSSNNGNAV